MDMRALPAAGAEDSPTLPDAKGQAAAKVASPHIHRPHPHGWWVLSGVALIGLIVCASAAAILNSRERALSLAEQQLQNLAFVLAGHATTTFEIIDRVEANLAERIAAAAITSPQDFEQKFAGHDTHLMLKDRKLGLPHVGAFTLVNAQGKIFNFSRSWPIPELDVSDRSFFQVLKADRTRTSFISEPIRKRSTGDRK